MHVDFSRSRQLETMNLQRLTFHPNTNILYGDNAQGKTNCWKLFSCGTTKSHKGSKDKELVSIGKARVSYQIASDQKK